MLKQKIILDTDIGDDIDDAYALALILEMPEVELVGITTVFLDTDKRSRIAKKILSLWNTDIPVYAGLRMGEKGDHAVDGIPCQYTSDLDEEPYAPCNDIRLDNGSGGVDFILRSVQRYGSELTLVAIGPLSNIAAAIKKDPETMRKLKRIVLMGGGFYQQWQEWNILCDPEAAKTVLEFDVEVVCIGIDVTEQTKLKNQQFQAILRADTDERIRYLSFLTQRFSDYTGNVPVLHDPLTVYYVAHPEILLTEYALVEVETEGHYSRGMTFNVDKLLSYAPIRHNKKRISIGKAVRAEEFLHSFLQIVFKFE